MKIAHLVPAMDQGGVERGIVEMNRAYVAAGHENTVVSAGGRLDAQIVADGGRTVKLDIKSKNPLTYFGRAFALRRVLAELSPDLAVVPSRVPGWLFAFANRTLRLPLVSFAHGLNSVSRYSRIMTAGEVVVVPSQCVADWLHNGYGTPYSKMRVIPRAVDAVRFDPAAIDRSFCAAKAREWGVEGRFVVMALGRITQLKGYDTLIRATALLAREMPDILAVIVGEAEKLRLEYAASLEKLVDSLGMRRHVIFAGPQTKAPECLSLAGVVVSANTRKPEAFGRSMTEALAMGRPVVATRFGGALDIVEDGVNGAFCECVPDGPGADAERARNLASAIRRVRAMSFGDLRSPCLEKFSFDRMVSLSIAACREAINSHR